MFRWSAGSETAGKVYSPNAAGVLVGRRDSLGLPGVCVRCTVAYVAVVRMCVRPKNETPNRRGLLTRWIIQFGVARLVVVPNAIVAFWSLNKRTSEKVSVSTF